eukprot:245451_1
MASVIVTFLCAIVRLSKAVTVNTDYGDIEGIINAFGIQQFKKIPYAKPPIDELRFSSPQLPDAWSPATLNAGEQPVPACPQKCILGTGNYGPCASADENCLFLNIYAPGNYGPADADNDSEYPVIIWFYGGAFNEGWNDFVGYDPTNIVLNNDVIVVAVNYRLGLLGFLYDNTYNTGVIGNYGLEDQLLSIQWVHDNIQNFGGDNDKIVLLGQSSGASSVLTHLLYNDKYFKAAIALSPSVSAPYRSPETWYDVPVQFTNLTDCMDDAADPVALLECWRNIPWETILNIQANYYTSKFSNGWPWFAQVFSPTIGTSLVPNQPLFAFQNNNIETKPFLTGSNHDEFFLFLNPDWIPIFGYNELVGILASFVGSLDVALQWVTFYGITPNASITENYLYDYGRIFSDNWICAIRNLVENTNDPEDIYYYNLETVDPQLAAVAQFREPCYPRTCHSIANHYTFLAPVFKDLYNENVISIGEEIQRLLTNYAEKGDPNGDGNEIWPEYENENDGNNFLRISGVNQFDAKSTFTEPDVHFCWFWDQVGYAGTYKLATNLNPPSKGDDDDDDSSGSLDSSDSLENALTGMRNEDNEEINSKGYIHNIIIDFSANVLVNIWILVIVILFGVFIVICFYKYYVNNVQCKRSTTDTAGVLYL